MKTLILFLLLPFAIVSQNIQWQWAKNVTNTVTAAGDNNLCAADSGNFYLTTQYNNLSRVIKYNAAGSELWRFNLQGAIRINGIAHSTNFFYVIGTFSNNLALGSITLTSSGFNDIFVAKYSSTGNVLWAKQFGGAQEDSGNGICTDTAGNIFLTGKYSGLATFGSYTANVGCSHQMFILKLNPLGNIVFMQNGQCITDTNSYSNGLKIRVDLSGNIYTIGTYDYFKIDTNIITGGGDDHVAFYMAKFNSSGNFLWAKQRSSSIKRFDVDTLQKITTVGSVLSPQVGTWTEIKKYDVSGNFLWDKSQAGMCGSYFHAGKAEGLVANNENVYACGVLGYCQPISQFLITKYNSAGTQLIYDTIPGNKISSTDIIGDSFGDYIVTGKVSGNMTFGGYNVNSNIFIAKFKEVNSVNSVIEIDKFNTINIYPNPTAGIFKIDGLIEGATIKIYDALGKKLKTMTTNRENLSIDLSNHPKGIYFVEVNLNGQRQTKRISYQ